MATRPAGGPGATSIRCRPPSPSGDERARASRRMAARHLERRKNRGLQKMVTEFCQASLLFSTGTPEQAVQLVAWLKGRDLTPELAANIRKMHPGWLAGADRLHWPIVETAKIAPGRSGRLNEVWVHLTNGEVSLLTIVLDHAIQIWPDMPSPQGFLWARWRSWPQLDGFWGGAVLLSRGESPRRIDASEWLKWEIRKILRAQEPKDKQLSEEQLQKIYRYASQIRSENAREQLSYHHMVFLGDLFEGWAQGKDISRENSAYFLGFAESMRALAKEVGPGWRPPEPETLDILGSMARWGLGE